MQLWRDVHDIDVDCYEDDNGDDGEDNDDDDVYIMMQCVFVCL